MRNLFAAVLLAWTAGPALAADDYPHVYLKNDTLKVKVYLPDAEKGFYRGTRFDHAGVFGEVEFAGHKLFGPWKEKHDPTNHDDIIGPAEEFGMQEPLGYADAKAGGTFLKIGVGELEKPKEEKYGFANRYKVVKPAGWKVSGSDRRVIDPKEGVLGGDGVVWATEQKANGYGYRYEKVLVLDRNSLHIAHILKNVGDKPITTDFYNHNFFNVDGDPIGPNYSIAFPFEVGAKDQKGKFGEVVELKRTELIFNGISEVKGTEWRFKDKFADGFVMAGLTGFDLKEDILRKSLNGFVLRHAPSRIAVAVVNGHPTTRLNVWGVRTVICPEPFIVIDNLKPGEVRKWGVRYDFAQHPPEKK